MEVKSEANIQAALRDLSKVAQRIAELREWQKLAQQERARNPHPELFVPDSDQQEIDTLCGSFMILDLDIHEALKRPDMDCTPEQKKRWQRRLAELERDFSILAGLTAA